MDGLWRSAGGRRRRRRIAIASLALLALAACGAKGARPNVVLITADTLRADHLGCYGYFRPTSPAIDALAAEGLLFERALATMSTTLPSHTSILTSSYPVRHGILSNLAFFHTPVETTDAFRTAAQLLSEAGYDTAAFTSSSPLSEESGIGAGFAVFVGPPSNESAEQRRVDVPAAETTDRALAWLERARPPFFLWVHYFDPHHPYAPPADYDRFRGSEPAMLEFLRERSVPEPSWPRSAEAGSLYDGEILYMDAQIGRLLERLREKGWYDDSAIVFTADHGEGLGQHGKWRHGQVWSEQVRAPLVFKLPAPAPARMGRRGDLASSIDILPTLVAALDLPIPRDRLDGIDLLSQQREYALAQREQRKEGVWATPMYSLSSLDWKYHWFATGAELLFDLRADPHETQSVVAEHPKVAKRMRTEVLRLIASGAEHSPLRVKPEIPDEIREKLRALGYLDD